MMQAAASRTREKCEHHGWILTMVDSTDALVHNEECIQGAARRWRGIPCTYLISTLTEASLRLSVPPHSEDWVVARPVFDDGDNLPQPSLSLCFGQR